MSEIIGKTPDIQKDVQRRRAIRGMGYLSLASVECPSGAFGQAAKIAALCKKSGDQPLELKEALFAHDDILEKLAERANNYHDKGKRKPIYVVEVADVINIIHGDFGFAQELMVLTLDQLQTISTDFYQEYRSDDALLAHDMERRVRDMLASKNP